MRNQAKIIGLGKRMKGISSKNNKPYDFQTVVFACPDRFIEQGVGAFTVTVRGEDIDSIGGIKLNQMVDIVYHSHNNAYYVDALLG